MKSLVGLCLSLLAVASVWAQRADIVVADFESASYGEWKTTGEAFGPGPAKGTLPNQMPVDEFRGERLANSYNEGDDSIGTLTSPAFRIERRYLNFLIGGGKHPDKACINLLVNGKTVRTATGPNDRPGGSERLDSHVWDVAEFEGQRAVVQIIDQVTGGWGHINIDHIVLSDRPAALWLTDARRAITFKKRYLHFGVKNGAPKRLISLLVDGRLVRQFDIELAEQQPDWWAFLDVTEFAGEAAILSVDRLPEDSKALEQIKQSDKLEGAENLYREALRPQFHFTSRRGWNNDPNGLVFYDGEYQLFYQHNPFGWNWGNMHWGQAVSRDLLHWEEFSDALYPDEFGTMFSGSAVVDWHNTTGFGSKEKPALVCMFTAAGKTSPWSKNQRFTQGLAYSIDKGRTWTKYERNPVLEHIAAENRDPKVFWHAPSKKWIMALYLDRNDFALFSSPDLKKWERLSDVKIEGSSECPEIFEMPMEGDKKNMRWVFYGGNGLYLVGRFDGRTFTRESGPHPLNFGNCFYASQTYNDIPEADGRRILVAWGQISFPGMPFNQMMDIPVELTLRNTDAGARLYVNPIREVKSLRGKRSEARSGLEIPAGETVELGKGELLDIELEWTAGKQVTLNVRGVAITYDGEKHELECLGKKASLRPVDDKVRLRLLVDRGSIEIFANDGHVYMPMGVLVKPEERRVTLTALGEAVQQVKSAVYQVSSVWR